MDYEQKYKEALEWMRSVYDGLHGATKEDAEHYFPELKESDDERIRKEILGLVQYTKGRRIGYEPRVHQDEMVTWLEKQSKSNPYSGVSFKYNGHIWGMCARDNGVEILFDGELKAFLSLEKSFIYPIYPKIDLAHIAHKSACGVAKEEKVDNQNCGISVYNEELAESEDEKIKKEIIAVFKGKIPYTSEEDAKRYIAWLEKQGEKSQGKSI